MVKWMIALLARAGGAWRNLAVKSLQAQLAQVKAVRDQYQTNYLVLADDHADLRAAYNRLAFERLQAWGLDRDNSGEPTKPMRYKGSARPKHRPAPFTNLGRNKEEQWKS